MNKAPIFLIITLFLFTNQIWSADLSIRPTLVAGFVNQGHQVDDGENIVITKTLINALSKVPGSKVAAYNETEKVAVKYNFQKNRTIEKDLAIRMAQELGYKQVITGSYQIDKANNIIHITVMVYDVITGDLSLQRNYSEKTGFGTIDAVMTMQGNLIGLLSGNQKQYFPLTFKVESTTNNYYLFINGRKSAELSQTNQYSDRFMSDEAIEYSIRLTNNGREVFRDSFIPDIKKKVIIYRPSCSIIVKAEGLGGQIYLNDESKGSLSSNATMTITSIEADKSQIISLRRKGKIFESVSIKLPEGESGYIVLGSSIGLYDYEKTSPVMSLLLPGFAQYQAGDFWMGTLFAVTAVGAAGFTGFCIYGYSVTSGKAQAAQTDSFKQTMNNYSSTWLILSIIGIAAYGIDGGISFLHAINQPTIKSEESSLTIEGLNADTQMLLCFKYKF